MNVEELERAVAKLPPRELAEFAAWFEAFQAQEVDPVPFDQIKHLLGVGEGPGDLSTNPKYMEGFGRRSLR